MLKDTARDARVRRDRESHRVKGRLANGVVLVSMVSIGGLLSGCGASSTYYAATNHVTYTANKEVDAEDDVRTVEADAPSLLRAGATIAFYPPDSCLTTNAAASGSEEKESFLRMQCGVLMSGLEKAAAVEGYRVVSWHLLKEGGALGRARELKVDALFEVDQLTVQARETGYTRKQDLSFSQVGPDGQLEPLPLETGEMGNRCNKVFRRGQMKVKTDSGTLALKMVGVSDGHAKWFFRRTVSEPPKAGDNEERYYKATGGGTSGLGYGLFGTGLVLGGISYGVLLTEKDARKDVGATVGILVLGTALIGGGIAALSLFRTDVPSAQSTICNGTASAPNPRPVSKPARSTDDDAESDEASGDRVSYTEKSAGERDIERDRRERLVHNVVAVFTTELRKLAATAASAPSPVPATAPPPAPAASAPPAATTTPPPPAASAPPAPAATPVCASDRDCKKGRVCRGGTCAVP